MSATNTCACRGSCDTASELAEIVACLDRFGVPFAYGTPDTVPMNLPPVRRVELALAELAGQAGQARAALGEVTVRLLAAERRVPILAAPSPEAERVEDLNALVALLEERLRVATGTRRPSPSDLERLDSLLHEVEAAAVAWAGYCPTCRGRGTVGVGSVVACCAACDGRGRVANGR